MRIHSIRATNYRPFTTLEEVRLGPLATIVGKNDSGKSSILFALDLFLNEKKMALEDVHHGASDEESVVIEVTFTLLPEKLQLEEGIDTTFADEMLLDSDGLLHIRKTYRRSDLAKPEIALIVRDFADERFAGLAKLKEGELNARCKNGGIDVTRSGRGITNKSKRDELRAAALHQGIAIGPGELSLVPRDDLWKNMVSLLPTFVLFQVDTKLGVGETTFQSQFRPVVGTAIEHSDVIAAREALTGAVRSALQTEVDQIFSRLSQHTDVFVGMKARPSFAWEKAVTFDIWGEDSHGVDVSLDQRGSGMRRLLMVAMFQYMAERAQPGGGLVFGVEEPENCLHPGLQRDLVRSFREISEKDHQVIVTTHSPVFAGASPIDDLALVVRHGGAAAAIQTPQLDLQQVAEELGVEPSDQITAYHACIFVEGPDDMLFWRTVASTLKTAGHVVSDFDDQQIGFAICGGTCLKYWVNKNCMKRLTRRFGVVVDSDRKSPQHAIPGEKRNWQRQCECDGGIFFITRKREIENYLHRDALVRAGLPSKSYDGYTDMKKLFGPKVCKHVQDMTADEILEMDRFVEEGVEHHELREIVEALLSLVS